MVPALCLAMVNQPSTDLLQALLKENPTLDDMLRSIRSWRREPFPLIFLFTMGSYYSATATISVHIHL